MKNATRIFFSAVFTATVLLTGSRSFGQMPQCIGSGGYIYVHAGSSIYNFDPTQPIVAGTNPFLNTIPMPAGAGGLAVSNNLNAAGPTPTFYTTVGGNYYYYNGSVWINTGHSVGNPAAVNPGAGGGYMYNLVGGTGQIYRYDGMSNGTLLVTIASFGGGGPYDVVCDCEGNFYLLRTSTSPYLQKYSPTGVLLQSWTVSGQTPSTAGGGLAIIGNNVYYQNASGYWAGVMSGTNVAFTLVSSTFPVSPGDFGSCPIGGIGFTAAPDTAYYCQGGTPAAFSVNSSGNFIWNVISGPAVISGSGSSITATAPPGSVSLIRVSASSGGSTSGCFANGADTVMLVAPTATVIAPATDSIRGCAVYVDTLHAFLNTNPTWLTYNPVWTPPGTITSGANTLNPVIAPTVNTIYTLTVSTPANQGGCSWSSTTSAVVVDKTVHADFNTTIHWGCSEDTVYFLNQSSPNTSHFWDFGNGNGDTAMNPTRIFTPQGTFNVKLSISNGTCKDSVIKPINTLHPLDASFTVSDDTVCQNQQISFTNTSVTTTKNGINPSFHWDFGDGNSSTQQSPTYTYTHPGIYKVVMTVKDFVPCTDTAVHTIVVDSATFVRFAVSDSVLCLGQGIRFVADYLAIGNTGTIWNFGDGTSLNNVNPVSHGFDSAKTYTVKFTATYRICPDTSFSKDITIKPFPRIDLGNDTTMCPNGEPVMLMNHLAASPSAVYKWNTGETTASIMAHNVGIYSATLTDDGCSSADSVEIFKNCYLDVPNAFTPDNDGNNDFFLPRQLLSKGVSSFNFVVYNRWGQTVFQTSSLNGRGWDGKFNGKDQPQGVYVYLIEVSFLNGSKEKYQGNVTLLR